MNKKNILILAVIIVSIITASSILDGEKNIKLVSNIIGASSYKYIKLIDTNKEYNLNDSVETYIFKINDLDKINCNTIKCNSKVVVLLNDFDRKYIHQDYKYCNCKYFEKNIKKKIFFIIQKDILLVKIFTT